jgi:hypothetical protein
MAGVPLWPGRGGFSGPSREVRKLPSDPVLRTLADHWDSVGGQLAGPAAERFRALVRRVSAAAATPGERMDAAAELVDLLIGELSAEHPVRRAIGDSAARRGPVAEQAPPDAAQEAVLAELRRLLDSGRATPESIAAEAERRLLAAPALSAADLRDRGGDPDQAHLIRLTGPQGRRLPVFQFDAGGQPIPVVLYINTLLDADADPWGVADWWLGRNAWLGGAPAESLGRVSDETLVGAARAAAGRG